MAICIAGCSSVTIKNKSEEPKESNVASDIKEETKEEPPAADNSSADNEVVDEVDVQYMDPDALIGTYSDKVSQRAMMDIVYNEAENVYGGGSGELTINEDMTITWIDDDKEEHIFERTP